MRRKAIVLLSLGLIACQPTAIENNADMLADNLEMEADNLDAAADKLLARSKSAGDDTGWTYEASKDEMRGATKRSATLSASTTIHLGFPYGDTNPVLNIRQDPKFGFDVFITSDGQPLCRSYQDDTISIKFDSGSIREWSCAEAADGSPGVVFFNSERKLLAAIKSSKKMVIELNYYNAGRQQVAFNTSGLKWQ